MNFGVPLLEDLPPLAGKSVLLRADFNEPVVEEPDGRRTLADDFRIRATLPTIDWLLEKGAHITVCAPISADPEGVYDPHLDMTPVRECLAELAPGVELMENLRFDQGELTNDPAFVDRLVAGHDCYVNDAFGVSHHAQASVVGPPTRLPSAAGRLLESEVEVLAQLIHHPLRPFVGHGCGGAKVADKLGVLHALAERVDTLIVGGGMAYTFLVAQGYDVASSLVDASHIGDCADLLALDVEILLPVDIVALSPDGKIGDDTHGEVRVFGRDLPAGWEGLDMGPQTRARYAEAIFSAKTVFWNGPFGVFEDPRFAAGTQAIAKAVAACPGFTVVGGGDTVSAIDTYGLAKSFDHVSTGGGAALEFIEFGDLPGLKALRDAPNNLASSHTASTRR